MSSVGVTLPQQASYEDLQLLLAPNKKHYQNLSQSSTVAPQSESDDEPVLTTIPENRDNQLCRTATLSSLGVVLPVQASYGELSQARNTGPRRRLQRLPSAGSTLDTAPGQPTFSNSHSDMSTIMSTITLDTENERGRRASELLRAHDPNWDPSVLDTDHHGHEPLEEAIISRDRSYNDNGVWTTTQEGLCGEEEVLVQPQMKPSPSLESLQ